MTLGQALLYFLGEASLSLVRSWKVSLVAVLTIGLSLYMSGLVVLATQNLEATVEGWREDLKVVVYLEPGISQADAELSALAGEPDWVREVHEVSSESAQERFATTFPTLQDLIGGWEEEGLPTSLEISLAAEAARTSGFDRWLDRLREHPQASMVDDDRDWVAQLGTVIAVVRTVGLTLGLTLLGAAIFTIASVVKLTAYLYLDEIAVMRLVGATEFFIRGPFYAEGVLQGLLGGAVALGGLWLTWALAGGDDAGGGLLDQLMTAGFLDWKWSLGLVALGAAAGLFGAVASLRREQLDRVAEVGEPAT